MLQWILSYWRDIVSIPAAVATFAALYYAIQQIRKTRSAAEAAAIAAADAAGESRRNFRRYALANAHRYLSEVNLYLSRQQWELAAMRLEDLAALIEQLAQLERDQSEWSFLATDLVKWQTTCKKLAVSTRKRFAADKWADFAAKVQTQIQRHSLPLEAKREETNHDH